MLDGYKVKYYPFRLLFYILVLNVMGVLVISSATDGDRGMVAKQIFGIVLGLVLVVFISFIHYRKIMELMWVVYGICIILLLAVLVFGYSPEGAGAIRWIKVPIIGQLQPSEIVKIGMILFIASFLGKHQEDVDRISFLIVFAAVAAIPCFLILKEPDLSTTIVVFIMILSMLFVSGISYRWVLGSLAFIIPSAAIFIFLLRSNVVPFLRGYQANRILGWIYPDKYADINVQQDNSIMAISSGQLMGKGLNNNTFASVKNGNFVSQDQTDFIFAVIGEELGFIGSMVVIVLFALIVIECFRLASKAKDLEGKLVCVGFAVLVGFQSFTNISVATGLFPNTGLPLPFISYGVSSLLSLYLGVGLVASVAVRQGKN
ncbi:FtsW/RodA/SpoVE family cell cycle protein [Lachnoanaerobaculum umeaense]|jgi:bacterial cell division membrane protein|uniref:Rod shape-determining protein RodA n=1 Tax=Lachnoanaerobaculum umeaense TaxID=617123 RepID=A0A385Q1E5_9FIRM|nr:FtsW/RodA/SpoVE family cell cycle protein [Lachnoanaerobaculum umeaense]AYA99404.1 rod shape-determining protein RodA [Lachnoanaerobaculum umeaense]PZW99504.1 rod shape determining protein RodA [Lachnoanaerobaculum umeaense]